MQSDDLYSRPRVLCGAFFYLVAKTLAKLQKWSVAERAYRLAQSSGFKPRQSLLNRVTILQIDKRIWQQKAILEDSLLYRKDVELAKRLARCNIQLELHRDAITTLSDYKEDVEILDITATALAKQGLILEYTSLLERIFKTQKTTHRYNQLFFAYGRCGHQDKLVNLLRNTLSSSKFNDQQKDRFIRASLEGMSRSFLFDHICTIQSSLEGVYHSSLLNIHAGMAYESLGKTSLAIEIYAQTHQSNSKYSWWATLRTAGIYYRNKQYKKAHAQLSLLIGKPVPNEINTPVLHAIEQAQKLANRKRFKDSSEVLLGIFPGWDISIWNDYDDLIFTDYYNAIRLLLSSKELDTEGYLQSLEKYSFRLAEKRLWKSANRALHLTKGLFEKQEKPLTEGIYTNIAKSLTNSGYPEESLRVISDGLKIYPQSLDLHIEKAQSYKKQLNVYKTKEVWDEIFSRFDASRLAPSAFTAAAESNLMSLNFREHERILSIARSVHGEFDRTLVYYTWQSTCTKIINLNTENSITGGSSFSSTYNLDDLVSQLIRFSELIVHYTYNDEMTHRIKHRAIQTFSLIMVNHWSAGDQKNVVDTLARLRSLLGASIPKTLLDSLFNLITHSRSNPDDRLVTIQKQISSTALGSIQFGDWMIIHQLLVVNKFLYAGYLAREKAIDEALYVSESGHLSTHYSMQKKFHAALERREFDIANTVLDRMKVNFPEQPINEDLLTLLTVQNPDTKVPTGNDPVYNRLIHNKTIAVVGPAPNNIPQGEEIDAHDEVVRFNYRGPMRATEHSTYGKRTSISYINGPNARAYFEPNIPAYMGDLKVFNVEFILNRAVGSEIKNQRARVNGLRTRLFNGIMMAVPAAILDTIQYHPKKITLYGTNFYLSSQQYSNHYTIHKGGVSRYDDRLEVLRLIELVGGHDLIAQKRFVSNLIDAGRIHADKDCLRVINMSDGEYMREMESLYTY